MRAVKKSTALVVRPRSSWRQNAMLSLAAFALTVAAVFFISQKFLRNSGLEKASKAIAIVEYKAVEDGENFPKSSVLGSSLNFKNIKTRIMSPAFMHQALRDCGIEALPTADKQARNASFISAEQLRQGLSIRTEPGEVSGENRIALELTLTQSPDAPKIARALAERFVSEYRTFWAAEAREARLAASDQADQARQAHREAVEKLQAFKDDIAKQKQLTPEQQPPQTQTARQTIPETVDNPAWVELNSKLATLRREEAGMLVNKTALHPDIQYIRELIADSERQLADIPRFVAESSAESATQELVLPSRDTIANQNETTATLEQLQGDVERTEREYSIILHHEQQIFEAGRKEPSFSINVNPVAIAKTEHKSNRGVIELMLLSGFAMAVGMSVLSSGVAIQPVLATIADLELLLPAPIIRVVPGKATSFDPVARRHCQTIFRWTLILTGGLIVLLSICGVYWFFANLTYLIT